MDINLVISLSDKDRSLLSGLLEKLSGPAVSAPSPAAPVEVKPEAQTPAAPVEEPKAYSIDDVRARVMILSRAGESTKAQVKDALKKYATKVPDLKPEDYGPFMADLDEIAKAAGVELGVTA